MDVITQDSITRRLLAFVIGWNLLDIALHVAAGEVEALRVTSNLLLIIVAAAILLGRAGAHPALPLAVVLLVFVVLNVIVFVDKGRLPIPMTILVTGSVVTSMLAISRLRRPSDQRARGTTSGRA